MQEDNLGSLRADLDKANIEVKELREKVSHAETWLRALAVVAFIFGIAGSVGWSVLSKARDQLTSLEAGVRKAKDDLGDFTAAKKRELSVEAAAAVASAVHGNDTSSRLGRVEAHIAQIGSGGASPSSGQPIGQVRHNMLASCPAGQVVNAVKANLGGTCNNQCNGDGQPLAQLELVCVKQ